MIQGKVTILLVGGGIKEIELSLNLQYTKLINLTD